MVAYLQKPEGSEVFHKIVDFLNTSHIKYALIENPKIYISLIQQFWGTATARTTDDGEVEITASIDRHVKTITEASLRRHLKLEDSDGITSLPNTEIFEQLTLMGYVSDSARLTFQKGHFSPQWSNMKMVSEGYSGVDFPLFPTMITTPKLSPSRITSSPSLSPQTYQSPQSSPLRDITRQDAKIPQSQFPTQTQVADEGSGTIHKTPTRPHDLPLLRVHTLRSDEGSLQQYELMDLVTKLTDRVEVLENVMQQTKKVYSSALTKLILRVKKLEKKVKTNKARRRARIVISEDKDAKEDSSKQGRKISEIDKDPTISLVQPEQDMEYDFDVSTAKGFTTASVPVTIASATLEVSIAAANLVYIRRSAEKRKDKGKAIMKEDESVQMKTKKQLEQEILGHKEAIRLQEQINEEENQRITRDAEIAKQLQEEFDRARQEQEVIAEVDQAHDIDWRGYKQSHFKGMSYEDIRPIFKRSSKKRSREDFDEDNAKKQKLEDDAEKKKLRDSMDVVPRDDIAIDVEADGSSKNYKIFSEMLDDFDRQDVLDLHRLVQEMYDTASPEGYNLLLWGDLKILFEPNEEDEIWKNQQDYNLISWRLFDSCGIHMLLMHTGIAIHMIIEKKYPLTQ
ncbi:hypothetical protein Tco_0773176 [Tanacetum coccineum]|uniref:Xylulose kinase-1 n=1 Tax=Tanacetum coccineum TaxID=301880 RepID=A0ABQ4ZK45_9ASTR